MANYLLQFEAFFIQPYLFKSNKLKEIIGASQNLESIVKDIDKRFFIPLFGKNAMLFLRKAGGVFIAETKDKQVYETTKKLWPLYVHQHAPGLQFGWAGTAYGEQTEHKTLAAGLKALREDLNIQKNMPRPTLPGIAPITQRYQRTGEAALPRPLLKKFYLPGHQQTAPLSENSLAKLNAADTQAFSHLLPDDTFRFPTCFNAPGENVCKPENAFPFKHGANPEAGEHDIAIIHADGNSIGGKIIELFKQLSTLKDEDYRITYRHFSQALDQATQNAAKHAIHLLAEKMDIQSGLLPIRPLILGGDDVLMIVRADIALFFMRTLIQHFEQESQRQLDQAFADKPELRNIFPSQLTMTCGICFLKSNQPFVMGYHLAESLAEYAKNTGRIINVEHPPSLIAFHQVTQTLFEQAEHQLQSELTVRDLSGDLSGTPQKIGQTIWALNPSQSPRPGTPPSLEALCELYQAFHTVCPEDRAVATFSFLRKLAYTLHTDPAHAKRMWFRWLENNTTDNVKQVLRNQGVSSPENWLDTQATIPLMDLLVLHRTESNVPLCSNGETHL